MSESFVKSLYTWILGFLFHLVIFQSAYELRDLDEIVVLEGLKSSDLVTPEKNVGNSSRVVLFVVGGLTLDFFSLKGNGSSFFYELMGGLAGRGIALGSEAINPADRLKEMLTGVHGMPEFQNSTKFESVLKFGKSVYVGPPSISPKDAAISKCFPSHWENSTLYPFPSAVDKWIFEQSLHVLQDPQAVDWRILVVFIPGLDTTHQLEGTDSNSSANELIQILNRIKTTYSLTERIMGDRRTSYILASDYRHEKGLPLWSTKPFRRVPFLTWGSGFSVEAQKYELRKEIKPSDIAPLISSMLNIPIPIHSFGTVPIHCLNGEALKAKALLKNAVQMSKLFGHFERKLGHGWSRYFAQTDTSKVKSHCKSGQISIDIGDFNSALIYAQEAITGSLSGIEYYSQFNDRHILLSLYMSFLGWIALVSVWVLSKIKLIPLIELEVNPQHEEPPQPIYSGVFQKLLKSGMMLDICCSLIFLTILGSLLLSDFPVSVVPSSLLFVGVLWLIARNFQNWIKLYKLFRTVSYRSSRGKLMFHMAYFLLWVAMGSYTFVNGAAFLWASIFSSMTDLRKKFKPYTNFWILSSLPFIMLMYAKQPENSSITYIFGATLWIIGSSCVLYAFSAKNVDYLLTLTYQLLLVLTLLKNNFKTSFYPEYDFLFTLLLPIMTIGLVPLFGAPKLPVRLLQIALAASTNLVNISSNTESVVLFIIANHLFSWLLIEGYDDIWEFCESSVSTSGKTDLLEWSDFRTTIYYVVYQLLSFLLISGSYELPEDAFSNGGNIFRVLMRYLPVALFVSVAENVIRRRMCPDRLVLKILVTSCASFVLVVFLPTRPSTIGIQMVFLILSILEPISSLLLFPSALSLIRKMRRTKPTEVIHVETDKESLPLQIISS